MAMHMRYKHTYNSSPSSAQEQQQGGNSLEIAL